MTKTYFTNPTNLEELRKQYKELLKKFHPDNPAGSTEACQEINAEYDQLFKKLKAAGKASASDTENQTQQKEYDFEQDSIFRDILFKIINFDGLEIEIVGTWLWLSGNTFPYKDQLKEIGFQWSRNRKKWHWSPIGNGYHKRGKKLSFDEIRNIYGSKTVTQQKKYALA